MLSYSFKHEDVHIERSLDTVRCLLFQEQLQDKKHLFDTDERRHCVLSALLQFVEK